MPLPILNVAITHEQDIVGARRRARQIATLLQFSAQDAIRIATAVSEIARNAFVYGRGGKAEFILDDTPPHSLLIRISDQGPGIAQLDAILAGNYQSPTGMGVGIVGARRLMDAFDIANQPGRGVAVTLRKHLPTTAPPLNPQAVDRIASTLAAQPQDYADEVRLQNRELLAALENLRHREEDLTRINRELEDTNRGVVALYAELDQRAEQLRHADRTKSRFLSYVSHEFRTPLNGIFGLSRLLLKRPEIASNPDITREIGLIQKTAQSLGELVNDLLDLAKVEAGKITVEPSTFDAASVFNALRTIMRPLASNPAVELVFEDPLDLPPLQTDDNKVSQILRNFVSNALKFTERGEVRVFAQYIPHRDLVSFTVADTGIGIPFGETTRIFDEFAQIQNPLQRRTKGTGLGLSLCKKLASLLGGSIDVESELGAGSRFTLFIPRVYSGAELTAEPQPPTIVVIDDEEISRYLLRRLLPPSLQILEAAGGVEGLELIRRCSPQAVILDLNMPGMSGLEVLEQLQSSPETRRIPIVIVTGQPIDRGLRQTLLASSAALINKHVLAGAEALDIDFGPPLLVTPRYAALPATQSS